MKLVDRPAKVITEANATVFHRASAWGMVERALLKVNQLAEELQVPEVRELAEASSAYNHLCGAFPPGSLGRADGWQRAVRAQFALLEACSDPKWGDAMFNTLDDVRAAREYYLEIGGSAHRAPMVGGIS